MNQVIAFCDNYLALSLTPGSGSLGIKQVSTQRHCPGLNFRVISNLCNNNNNNNNEQKKQVVHLRLGNPLYKSENNDKTKSSQAA